MKTFPLRLTDELHKEIRSKAFKAEKSMHAYILECIRISGELVGTDLIKIPNNLEPTKETKEPEVTHACNEGCCDTDTHHYCNKDHTKQPTLTLTCGDCGEGFKELTTGTDNYSGDSFQYCDKCMLKNYGNKQPTEVSKGDYERLKNGEVITVPISKKSKPTKDKPLGITKKDSMK